MGIRLLLAAAGLLAGQLQTALSPTDGTVPLFEVREEGASGGAWVATNYWDEEAEAEYGRFVGALGRARERKVFRLAQGLDDPVVNPYYDPADGKLKFDADCATLPYALRAYFAYKTSRPFVFTANKGRRYCFSNRPEDLHDHTDYRDFPHLFNGALSAVSSGHFRMKATMEGTDTYPIVISRGSIRPGVNYYDPAGHVLVVYRVDGLTGDVYMMDGHPDGTMTLKRFDPRIRHGSSRSGAGFRRWRHDHMIPLEGGMDGAFLRQRETNAESAYFSATDQYRYHYVLDGVEMKYHEWVKAILSEDGARVDAVSAFERRAERVCDLLLERTVAVESARFSGLPDGPQLEMHRKRPYWGNDAWHSESTAVLDVNLRGAIDELRRFVRQAERWAAEGSPRLEGTCQGTKGEIFPEGRGAKDASSPVAHVGGCLAGAAGAVELSERLAAKWREMDSRPECTVVYSNSHGELVPVSLTDAVARIRDMSFDPSHCPEMRWGAIPGGTDRVLEWEAASCPASAEKMSAWRRQALLRRAHRLLLRPFEEHARLPNVPLPALRALP